MPTLDWLKKEFHYGYDSGDILSLIPSLQRYKEQKLSGGSYKKVFMEAVLPHLRPDAAVLEIGPGRGSWTNAILKYLPHGTLHVVDFQDVSKWLHPERFEGRLVCHRISDNNYYSTFPENSFDFCWSFGVFVHFNVAHIQEVLRNILPIIKPGGIVSFNFADWEKLEAFGWKRSGIPLEFKDKPDDEIWWPRNDKATMRRVAADTGWEVVSIDLDILKRDPVIVLRKPSAR